MATTGRRRAYGQHFLQDRGAASSIADWAISALVGTKSRTLVEIGPGKGAITDPILKRLDQAPLLERMLIIEKDKAIAERWEERARVESHLKQIARQTADPSSPTAAPAPAPPRIDVLSADFLLVDEDEWTAPAPVTIVSNLPYSSGTAILSRLAARTDAISAMVLMFQAEVAQRLRAAPSTKSRGSLSVWIQNCWDVEKKLLVKPRAFSPPPEVDSEVVLLSRRQTPHVPVPRTKEAERLWQGLLKRCFSQRRKMLRSTLKGDPRLQNALAASGVDGTKRAEALDWEEWRSLFLAALETGGDRGAGQGES